jgi:hypothetical protein
MENDQIWESVIQRTEHELLEPGDLDTSSDRVKTSAAPQLMAAIDITSFIEVTAQSHGCNPQNISYYYEPIIGEDGCVSLDELFLVFSLKSLVDGELSDRPIHTIRVTVPQEVQQRARAMLEKDIRAPSVSPMRDDSRATIAITESSAPAVAVPVVSVATTTAKKGSRKRVGAKKI